MEDEWLPPSICMKYSRKNKRRTASVGYDTDSPVCILRNTFVRNSIIKEEKAEKEAKHKIRSAHAPKVVLYVKIFTSKKGGRAEMREEMLEGMMGERKKEGYEENIRGICRENRKAQI